MCGKTNEYVCCAIHLYIRGWASNPSWLFVVSTVAQVSVLMTFGSLESPPGVLLHNPTLADTPNDMPEPSSCAQLSFLWCMGSRGASCSRSICSYTLGPQIAARDPECFVSRLAVAFRCPGQMEMKHKSLEILKLHDVPGSFPKADPLIFVVLSEWHTWVGMAAE